VAKNGADEALNYNSSVYCCEILDSLCNLMKVSSCKYLEELRINLDRNDKQIEQT